MFGLRNELSHRNWKQFISDKKGTAAMESSVSACSANSKKCEVCNELRCPVPVRVFKPLKQEYGQTGCKKLWSAREHFENTNTCRWSRPGDFFFSSGEGFAGSYTNIEPAVMADVNGAIGIYVNRSADAWGLCCNGTVLLVLDGMESFWGSNTFLLYFTGFKTLLPCS